MTPLTRKQIYIEARQDARLKRLAKARGVSQAELIREAIDRHLDSSARSWQPDARAWEQARRLMLALQAQGPLPRRPRNWTREDLYKERMSRYDRHSD